MARYLIFFLLIINSHFKLSYAQKYDNIRDIFSNAERIWGNYIPYDLQDALKELDTIFTKEEKLYIKDSLPLGRFASLSHFGSALYIRNRWAMWLKSRIVVYFNKYDIYHPDTISGIIMEAFDYKLHGKHFDFKKYINDVPHAKKVTIFNKKWWDNRKERNRAIKKMKKTLTNKGFSKGEILYFTYLYGVSSQEELDTINTIHRKGYIVNGREKQLPQGIITNVDYQKGTFQVKLLSSFDPRGVILFDGDNEPSDIYRKGLVPFLNNGSNKYYMEIGDKLWFSTNDDYWFTKSSINESFLYDEKSYDED